jgi:serine---pyruvate transaminase
MEVKLFTPGPTPVPKEIRDAGAQPMIHHRSEDFSKILKAARDSLKTFCDCDGEVLLFSSSGSGGMEACVTSLFAPGDEVVVVEGGKFGERWVDLAKHYKLNLKVIKVEWGKAVRPEAVLSAITPNTRGLLIQACESSTGAYHPISQIGEALPKAQDLMFVVDAITALGVHDISMVRDRIDALICGSQKAFMCPPGLATVSLSVRAIDRLSKVQPMGFYFSLQRELKAQVKGQTAFTPAISLICAFQAALSQLETIGKEGLFKRQKLLQKMARTAFREDGFSLFNSDEDATWGITVAHAPKEVELKAWLKMLKTEHGMWLAGGQGELEGKIFRISHMGAIGAKDLLWGLETIETSLANYYPNARDRRGSAAAREMVK